ncbi:GNAT family N-acetyltransferase [Pontibacter toksunensis]|uniref:GNAT family N-acetyltransferase n=1 Tax=Pontibacter toksunensis TaxID=1332631 RepID=A0ABW6BX71_9BACT
MDVIVREVALEDSEAICNLLEQLGYNAFVPETAERIKAVMADEMHCAFVAVAKGNVVGWIHGFFAIRIESAPFVEIGGLVLDTSARGAGVGRRLVEQVMEWSKQRSIIKLRVRTNSARSKTHQFYQNLGFTETKEQKVFELKL